MNEIVVVQRDWKISEIKSKIKFDQDGIDKFDKGKSIFKNFREDTEEILKRMFELDFNFSKISRAVKNEVEL